jgi:hypothetical protein
VLEDFLKLVDPMIRQRSGSVMYSGRRAFASPSPVYLLGLNPGGDPLAMAANTIDRNIKESTDRKQEDWSAYRDESWGGRRPGASQVQRRVLHLFQRLGLEAGRVPSSNVVFVRTNREAALAREKPSLLAACWPVHRSVIETLGVRTVVCMGGTAGRWVRESLGADELVDEFVELNARRWTSQLHVNGEGRFVATLTHPSVAAWDVTATDPSALVVRSLSAP